jgi:hypothetical protein
VSITSKLSIRSSRARFLFASVIATNTLSLDGHAFTCEASGASGDQFNVGADDEETAANAAAAINASSTSGIASVMFAWSDGAILYVQKTGGNIALASSGSTIEVAWVVDASQEFEVLATFVQSGGADTDPISAAVTSLAPQAPIYQTIERINGTVIKASATTAVPFPFVILTAQEGQRYSIGGSYTTDGSTTVNFTPAIAYAHLAMLGSQT